MEQLIRLLREGNYSCVIDNGVEVRTCHGRGVSDLYGLLTQEPCQLQGARVADKAVGKAAAALLALGGVREVYASVISAPARALLEKAGVGVTFAEEVPVIWNRDRSDWCPLEKLCVEENSPETIFPLIETFIKAQKNK